MANQRFGKTFSGYKKIRESFFDKKFNDAIVERLHFADQLYLQQPKRTACKLCASDLREVTFKRNQVPYFLCDSCGHLNGGHEDTETYNQSLYEDEDSAIATNSSYSDSDLEKYLFRVDNIYRPKADWLYRELSMLDEHCSGLNVVDVGTGAGHMVKALIDAGFKNSCGFDVYQPNLDLGNRMIGSNALFKSQIDSAVDLLGSLEAEVISSIFMLEHISQPLEWLRMLKRNPKIRYALIAVPMFSPTVVMELVFPHVMHRSLGLAHTHLFTKKSIEWMLEECGLEVLSEWWFGADAFDLHRNIHMHLRHTLKSETLAHLWDDMVISSLDNIQLSFDKNFASSEVHLIVRAE